MGNTQQYSFVICDSCGGFAGQVNCADCSSSFCSESCKATHTPSKCQETKRVNDIVMRIETVGLEQMRAEMLGPRRVRLSDSDESSEPDESDV